MVRTGIYRQVVTPPQAKPGLVRLPRRRAVERSFARATRGRRLARNHERLPPIPAGLQLATFAGLMLHTAAQIGPVDDGL